MYGMPQSLGIKHSVQFVVSQYVMIRVKFYDLWIFVSTGVCLAYFICQITVMGSLEALPCLEVTRGSILFSRSWSWSWKVESNCLGPITRQKYNTANAKLCLFVFLQHGVSNNVNSSSNDGQLSVLVSVAGSYVEPSAALEESGFSRCVHILNIFLWN